jgi:hypothetical protein
MNRYREIDTKEKRKKNVCCVCVAKAAAIIKQLFFVCCGCTYLTCLSWVGRLYNNPLEKNTSQSFAISSRE